MQDHPRTYAHGEHPYATVRSVAITLENARIFIIENSSEPLMGFIKAWFLLFWRNDSQALKLMSAVNDQKHNHNNVVLSSNSSSEFKLKELQQHPSI